MFGMQAAQVQGPNSNRSDISHLLKINLLTHRQCCQGTPCRLCQIHGSRCLYDETADQRRRVSKQRLLDEYQRQRLLLLGIIATIRTQSAADVQRLVDLIRSQVPLPQLSSYVESMLAASPELSEARRQLSLGEDNLQGHATVAEVSGDAAQLALEPERSSGLPMNAETILDVHP